MVRFSLSKLSALAAVSAVAALAIAGTPARAEQPLTNLGPVGPYEPLITEFGGKRVLAFYRPDNGRCAVNAVVWDMDAHAGPNPYSSSRVRLDLRPGQAFHLDSTGNESLNLICGKGAATMAIGN
jgi:transglutaminase-like putative cysteine protease